MNTDMNRAYKRVRGKSTVIPSPYGDIEYTEGGTGPPVLVIHGSGGGYDQGQLIVDIFLDGRFHWIAPSRFGYLRSTFRDGATFDDQAHAYAVLLDHLGLESVGVVAFSHGGPSALLLALLYPGRVSSLTLVSAGVAAGSTEDQGKADQKGSILTTIFKHNWLLPPFLAPGWSVSREAATCSWLSSSQPSARPWRSTSSTTPGSWRCGARKCNRGL